MGQILAIRAQVEELVVDEESLAFLGEIGQQTSLRFGFLIGCSYAFLSFVTYTCCISGMQFNCYHLPALLQK